MVSWFDLFSCASAQSSPVRQVGGRFPHAPADFNQAALANSRNAPGLSNQLERLLSLFACSWPMNSLADVAPASSPASSPASLPASASGLPPGVRASGETPPQLAAGTAVALRGSWRASSPYSHALGPGT